MASIRPSLRVTETYTETNFLRLYLYAAEHASEGLVTLEHLCFDSGRQGAAAWSCLTIVDAEWMSRSDAVFIARSYAAEHGISVIYECPVE